MPRPAAAPTLDALVRDALEPVVKRASARDRPCRRAADGRAARDGARGQRGARGARPAVAAARPAPRRGRAARSSRWAADRRARRVPNFVIDLTGLKTKKQIVAKYGDGVVFEKGKPAPRPK